MKMELLSYQKGDILFSNCQTLVNPVSCDGIIDSNLSKRFFTRYPAMLVKYQYFCKEQLFTPGKLWVYQSRTKKILNFPVKETSSGEIQPEVLEASFGRLAETFQDRNISSIAFPRFYQPNLFNDGIEIQRIMDTYLPRLSIPTVIYIDYIPHSKTLIPLIAKLVGVLSEEDKKNIKERLCFEGICPPSPSENGRFGVYHIG